MKIHELLVEKRASAKLCRKAKEGKKIGASARSSCVAQGQLPRRSHHTAGTGKQGKKGSGDPVHGKTEPSEKYGGKIKSYP